jgi:peptide deformylase
MIYDLVKSDDKILRECGLRFDFENPPVDPVELATNLKESMITHGGLGLSACQVGLPWRVFVAGNPNDPSNIKVFFNPNIVSTSENLVLMEEGCLSYPGLFIKVKRPDSIRIRYAGSNGHITTDVFDSIPARVIQHEYDHMDGIVFKNRSSKFHYEQAVRQKKRLDKKRKLNEQRVRVL